MRIISLISVADVFTLLNALFGFVAIVLIFESEIELGILLIFLAVLADGVDGFVARRFSKKWNLGDYLDIMADAISFCVAPAFLIITLYFDKGLGFNGVASKLLVLFTSAILITFGQLRLSRFCYEFGKEARFFVGLPAPASALTVSTLCLLELKGVLTPLITMPIIIAVAVLMISDIQYHKMQGRLAVISGSIILLVILTELINLILPLKFNWVFSSILLISALTYIIGSPLAVRFVFKKGSE